MKLIIIEVYNILILALKYLGNKIEYLYMLKIKLQSMQNGVHRGKKQETEAKSKIG